MTTTAGWVTHDRAEGMQEIMPINDVVLHESGPDCACGPDIRATSRATVVAHFALDGRD